jgi:hypothetical protein
MNKPLSKKGNIIGWVVMFIVALPIVRLIFVFITAI